MPADRVMPTEAAADLIRLVRDLTDTPHRRSNDSGRSPTPSIRSEWQVG